MAKKTATVAYEDPAHDRKEAAYFSKVRRSLDEMGAPNSGELLHNAKAYVEGVYRAGVAPEMAASVLWHQHCGRAGQKETPCVAECPCPTEAACPPDGKPDAVAVVAVGEEARRTKSRKQSPPVYHSSVWPFTTTTPPHGSGPAPVAVPAVETSVQYKDYTIEIVGPGPNWQYLVITPTGDLIEGGAAAGPGNALASGKRAVDTYSSMGLRETAEAHDSAPCVPFTRLERNNEAFLACQKFAKGPIETDLDMFHLLSQQLGREDQEVFVVVGLDLHRNLRSYTEVARGQRDRVSVNVEDVMRAVIADGPHGFVVAHNHPSGQAHPSQKDKELTEKIRSAASVACPSVVFLDHIVVGQNQYYSFEDKKLKHVR